MATQCRTANFIGSEAEAFTERLDAAQISIGGDIKHRTIITEGAVCRGHTSGNRSEMLAAGREYQHSTGAGGPEVAVLIDLHSVGQALLFFDHAGDVRKKSAVG